MNRINHYFYWIGFVCCLFISCGKAHTPDSTIRAAGEDIQYTVMDVKSRPEYCINYNTINNPVIKTPNAPSGCITYATHEDDEEFLIVTISTSLLTFNNTDKLIRFREFYLYDGNTEKHYPMLYMGNGHKLSEVLKLNKTYSRSLVFKIKDSEIPGNIGYKNELFPLLAE